VIPMPPTSPRSTPRRFSAPRLAPWPFLLFLALLAGCGGDAPPAGDQGGGAPAPDVQAAAEKPPLDPAELAPVIREVAPSGVAPSRIAIEFARRVVGDDRVGKAAGASSASSASAPPTRPAPTPASTSASATPTAPTKSPSAGPTAGSGS